MKVKKENEVVKPWLSTITWTKLKDKKCLWQDRLIKWPNPGQASQKWNHWKDWPWMPISPIWKMLVLCTSNFYVWIANFCQKSGKIWYQFWKNNYQFWPESWAQLWDRTWSKKFWRRKNFLRQNTTIYIKTMVSFTMIVNPIEM